MAEMDAFEHQVADVARRVVGPARPVDAMAIARAAQSDDPVRVPLPHVTATTLARWRWRPALTVMLLSGTVLLALIGSMVMTGGGPSTLPAAVDEVVPLLPAEIPASIPHGVIDTPIGLARWAHLSGSPTTLPGPLTPLLGPGGLLWFDEGGHGPVACEDSGRLECTALPQLWASADAISERIERALPVSAERAALTPLDGTWWLTTYRPTTLWRSTDAETWEEIDLTALVSPGPAELDWELQLGEPATASGTTLVPVAYEARDGARLLGWPAGRFMRPQRSGSGTYRVTDLRHEGPQDVGEVRIEETASGLRFAHVAGDTIATLDGVGIDFVEAWESTSTIQDHNLALVDDRAARPVQLPGRSRFDSRDNVTTLLGTDTGFHAFLTLVDGTIRTWRSTDGRTWTEGPPLGDEDGEPQDPEGIYVRPGRDGRPAVVAVTIDTEAQAQHAMHWESANGASWTLTADIPDTLFPIRVGDGWLSWYDLEGWRASIDGSTWEEAPVLSELIWKSATSGAGSVGPPDAIGSTLFYAVNEEEGTRQRDLWILEFDR